METGLDSMTKASGLLRIVKLFFMLSRKSLSLFNSTKLTALLNR